MQQYISYQDPFKKLALFTAFSQFYHSFLSVFCANFQQQQQQQQQQKRGNERRLQIQTATFTRDRFNKKQLDCKLLNNWRERLNGWPQVSW